MSSDSVSQPSSRPLPAALVMRIAGRPGPTFVLRADRDNTLGRSPDATIVVADRLASRIHAAVRFDPGRSAWMLHDLGSRNGTSLDGVQVTEAVVDDGAVIRLGTAELAFKLLPPSRAERPADGDQFVRRGPVAELEGSVLRRASTGSADDVRRPLLLYQASIRLLAARSSREVIEAALALAAEHAGAAGVGWFRVVPPDQLEPVCVAPPGSPVAAVLDPATARLVAAGQAVWTTAGAASADAEIVCVPIVEDGRVHAALAAAATRGGIRPIDFDALVALGSLASAACSGHATPQPPCQPADIGSEPTIDLQSVLLLAEEAAGGDPAAATSIVDGESAESPSPLDEAGLRRTVPAEADGSPADARIGSFVAKAGTLRLHDWQRMLVIEALRRTGGSLPGAATALGISRDALRRTLDSYGLRR